MTNGFMSRYYDWGDFEKFVKELYEADGDVVVERDVREKDQFGALRQTDVKLTRKTRFHTYVTLIECKRWKEPVSRDRVDVLAASVEGLRAQKGAIFTTTGYEEGALNYAKGKNIDVFVIRDLTDEEWGSPGRNVDFHMHLWAGKYGQLQLPNAQFIRLAPGPLGNLDLHLDKDRVSDPQYDLYPINGGPSCSNLLRLLIDAHQMILQSMSKGLPILESEADKVDVAIECSGQIDFASCRCRQLRLPVGLLTFERVEFQFQASVIQTHFRFDRGAKFDFALVIENYLTSQRHVAHRVLGDTEIRFDPKEAVPEVSPDDVLKNGSLFQVICSPWVLPDAVPGAKKGLVTKPIYIRAIDADGRLVLQMQ